MAARFPGACNIEQFWNNLKNGVESIAFFSDGELKQEGVGTKTLQHPRYVRAKAVIEDIENFDAPFFDYLHSEAEFMDPQVRKFHECSWQALEDAGYDPSTYDGLIGLYAGLTPNYWWIARVFSRMRGGSEVLTGHYLNSNFFGTLISYKLNLKGPAITVQTSCSTSLTSIHQACRALLTGECDMAMAGGVTIVLPQKLGYYHLDGMVHSPDGHCRAFDADANGTVGGDGLGIVVLKRLNRAIADRDNIYAIVKGSAANNDGSRKVGYTAPSVEGQTEVITAVHHMAEVEPESIGYIETHGTGTSLGDPIEIEALKLAFDTKKKGFCRIGSVKSNIGHLDSAAGVAGFIKAVLSLKHKRIPPSLHFQTPNPAIDFKNSPFRVITGLYEWKNDHGPLRAGVSSFGIGGTNAHVVLEEAPPMQAVGSSGREQLLLVLSARTEPALQRVSENIVHYLKSNPGVNLQDVVYTLQVGRKAFEYRRMLVCSGVQEDIDALSSAGSGSVYEFAPKEGIPGIVFMFSGQGSQYIDMGLGLYQTESVFGEAADRCFDILKPIIGYDIKTIMYPAGEAEREKARQQIDQIDNAPLVNFIIEYALARLLMHWGIRPYAMIGHSLGEYVAATLSGVFSLEDALNLAAVRGRLMKRLPAGVMMSVPLSEGELKLYLNDDISLAADHGQSCLVSGSHRAIDALEKTLKEKRLLCQRLIITHAGHSNVMDFIMDEFKQVAAGVTYNKPEIPFISTVTANWISIEKATDPQYWVDHMRETVRFAPGFKELLKTRKSLFIEIGSGNVLSTIAMQFMDKDSKHRVMNLIRYPERKVSDVGFLLNRVGRIWLYGGEIDWHGFHAGEERCRLPLPVYPFEKRRFPVDLEDLRAVISGHGEAVVEKSGRKTNVADWFYVPTWSPSFLPVYTGQSGDDARKHPWLLFIDETGFGARLAERLRQVGLEVLTVSAGPGTDTEVEADFVVEPQQADDYSRLVETLNRSGSLPGTIAHLWGISGGLDEDEPAQTIAERVDSAREQGFGSLVYLAQALGKHNVSHDIHLVAVGSGLQSHPGAAENHPR
jgi:acyl transferase domain-containing protein